MRTPFWLVGLLGTLAGCSIRPPEPNTMPDPFDIIRETRHRGDDDLVSAGLGLDGLRGPPPAVLDPKAPTAAELRRRAFYFNWRGIADLRPEGGFGRDYGGVPQVPGREYHAFARRPGARQPHRVLAQIPDAFDRRRRCLVVTPVSGSRGIYGAVAFTGAWALPKGCAVVYTDKGAGSGWFDFASDEGVALDGTRARRGAAVLEFEPDSDPERVPRVAVKHAHSGDHPEADWGGHTLDAMAFGLAMLTRAFPELGPFTPENTLILAAGLSNGGAAVLRAAELDAGAAFDAVLAVAPNVHVEGTRPLYDYASEAALLMPCALALPELAAGPSLLPNPIDPEAALGHCRALSDAGVLNATEPRTAASEAYARLRTGGWTEPALRLARLHTELGLWRTITAAYAHAYLRRSVQQPLCELDYAVLDPGGQARPSTAAERAQWWSDTAGLPPGGGVQLRFDRRTSDLCLRELWTGASTLAGALRTAVAATRASARPRSARVLVLHGIDDGLIPIDFSSRPYAEAARSAGHSVLLWPLERAQHFDAFLAAPGMADYRPLLRSAYRALDLLLEACLEQRALPPEPPPDLDADRSGL